MKAGLTRLIEIGSAPLLTGRRVARSSIGGAGNERIDLVLVGVRMGLPKKGHTDYCIIIYYK